MPVHDNKGMNLNTLKDLYIHELKDLYSAEKQLTKALPKMAKAANNADLKAGFQTHLEETKEHVARLEKVLSMHDQSTRGPKCKAMEGLVAEGAEHMEEEGDPEVLDAGLIVAAQKVEHYEIAGYGSVCTFAKLLGDKAGLEILKLTLNEEETTDKKLTKLATSVINLEAAK
jgi:ferritin-like metal-binding protein YciE